MDKDMMKKLISTMTHIRVCRGGVVTTQKKRTEIGETAKDGNKVSARAKRDNI